MRAGVQYGGAAAGEELNLGMIGRAIWRHKLLIILPTLVVAVLAFVGASLLTPRYKSEARVLIEGRENIFLRPEAEKSMTDRGTVDAETVTSQVQLILSRDLARDVIKELNLIDSPEFNAALRESSPLSLLRTIGILKDPMSMAPEERVLAAYYERLTAFAIDKSRVISIEFQSADPELAARAANLIAKRYLSFQQVARQEQTRSAGQWLSGELEKMRQKVSEAEAKVEDFRGKSNLYIGSNNTSLVNQQLTELSSQVSAARAQKADAETRARSLRDALRSGQSLDSADVATSELIRRLSEQRVTLKAQLAEQSSTLLPQHPRIKELKAQITDLETQIRGEGDRIARSFEREARVAGSRLEALSGNLDQFKRQTASTSDQDVQMRALEREAKAQRDLFESYLAKYRETAARDSIAAAPADARIISSAVVSNVPYFPKKVPITLIGALGTLCLSMAFVVTAALLNGENYRQARRKTDVEVDFVERPVDAQTRADDSWPADRNASEAEVPPASMAQFARAGDDNKPPASATKSKAEPLAPVSATPSADAKPHDHAPASTVSPKPSTPAAPFVSAFAARTAEIKLADDKRDLPKLSVPEVPPFVPASAPRVHSTADEIVDSPKCLISATPVASFAAAKAVDTEVADSKSDEGLPVEPKPSTPEVSSVVSVSASQPADIKVDETMVPPKWLMSETSASSATAKITDTNVVDKKFDEYLSALPKPSIPDVPPFAPAFAPKVADTEADDLAPFTPKLSSSEVPPFVPTAAPLSSHSVPDEPPYAASYLSNPPEAQRFGQGDEEGLYGASDLPNPEAPPLAPAPQSAGTKIDDIIAAMHRAGEVGRRVAVIGSARYVGTTLTAIALARTLARDARVVLVDLAFASANVDADTKQPDSSGIADLVRGDASFSDIIIRDPGSNAHLVTVGQVKNDVQALLQSEVLWDAVYALAQSYDYLVLDAGAQSDTVADQVAATAPYALLVCGDTPVVTITGLAGQLQRAGFAHVAITSGAPPALEEANAQSAA